MRLEVAVEQRARAEVREGGGELREERGGLGLVGRDGPRLGADEAREVGGAELEEEEDVSGGGGGVEHLHDVWVVERAHDAHLGREQLHRLLREARAVDRLHRDRRAAAVGGLGAVDGREAAAADALDQTVPADHRSLAQRLAKP